jgi:hypothetical protein
LNADKGLAPLLCGSKKMQFAVDYLGFFAAIGWLFQPIQPVI